MKTRLYQGKFVYNFRLTELDTVKCSHGWNNAMKYIFVFSSWHIWYSPSHKQASYFMVLEVLFEKSNFSFHIPWSVRLSWYMTPLTVKVQTQYKLALLVKKSPELFPSLRYTKLFCCNSSLPQLNWFACWLPCSDRWVLETPEFKTHHSKMFCVKFWNSSGWVVQESECELRLRRLAMSPQKTCLDPHPRGKSRTHPKFLHSCT